MQFTASYLETQPKQPATKSRCLARVIYMPRINIRWRRRIAPSARGLNFQYGQTRSRLSAGFAEGVVR
jgi:hypothetical protein